MAEISSKLANVGVVSEEVSTFDDARIVRMSPAWLYKKGEFMGVPFKLGARWSSRSPDDVTLIVSYSGTVRSKAYTNISGLDINMGGNMQFFEASGSTRHESSGYNSVSKTIYTESSRPVIVPLKTLKAMLSAADVRLRIRSMDGYVEAHFSVARMPGGQETAVARLGEFVARVENK